MEPRDGEARAAIPRQVENAVGVCAARAPSSRRRCFEKTGVHSPAELSRRPTLFPPAGSRHDRGSA
jgi:hypothetical protein